MKPSEHAETSTPSKGEALACCPKCKDFYLYNFKTGELLKPGCKAYACEYCGGKKAKRLEQALTNYLSKYKHIRLFTFTLNTNAFATQTTALKHVSEIWRRFINNLRRCKALSESQRNVNYIKVLELTKRGYPHYHCFMLEYLPWQIIQALWNDAVKTVTGYSGKGGHVNIKHSFTPERAARYVVKYVLKSVHEKRWTLRLWSKSGNVALFKPKQQTGEWSFINARTSDLNLSIFSITSQKEVEIRKFCSLPQRKNFAMPIPPPRL